MLKNISNLGSVLNRSEQISVFGGDGPCAVRCKSGALILNLPDGGPETSALACKNQGGSAGSICVGDSL